MKLTREDIEDGLLMLGIPRLYRPGAPLGISDRALLRRSRKILGPDDRVLTHPDRLAHPGGPLRPRTRREARLHALARARRFYRADVEAYLNPAPLYARRLAAMEWARRAIRRASSAR